MSLLNYSLSNLPIMEPKIKVEPEVYHFRPYDSTLKPFLTPTSRTSGNHFEIFQTSQDSLPKSPENIVESEEELSQNDEERSNESVQQNSLEILLIFLEGEWNKVEHHQFLQGYAQYEKNWALIARDYVPTRSRQQVRNHAVKFFMKMEKNQKYQ
jgi:hypothetical protein